ncbi:MAG: exported protein of unknown function [Hyphomicrobiales bacterium]|nr:exported protein of unknown function [Hyphomicrobiales bacterium]
MHPSRTLPALVLATLAAAPMQAQAQAQDWAQQQVDRYVRVWSTNEGVNRDSMREFYADRVVYYGRSMTREQVFADKLRYIAHWPQREYRMVPGTVSAKCDSAHEVCRATGVMRWSRTSNTGRSASGESRMSFTLTRSSGGKIIRESAVTLR